MSYGNIVRHIGIIRCRMSESPKTYDDTVRPRMRYRNLRYDVRYCLPGAAFAAGRTGHAPGAPTGPASWSSALPDGLYCIVTVLTQSGICGCDQCEWWQPHTRKNGNMWPGDIVVDPVASRGQRTEWQGRWTPGDAGRARPRRGAEPACRTGQVIVSSQNSTYSSQNTPTFESYTCTLARVQKSMSTRAIKMRIYAIAKDL